MSEMRTLGDVTVMIRTGVVQFFHGIPKPTVGKADVLADFWEVGDTKGGAKPFHHIHHGNAVKTQRVIFDFKLGLWPIERLVHQIKILQFHCKNLRGKTLKKAASARRYQRRQVFSMTDQIRKANAHPRRFETMRWRSAFH